MKRTNLLLLLFSVAGALILMCYAFFNGFPIVYSDTSTYIASGFELQTPVDRPITYGLFLRVFSLNGFSLWLPVFFQCLALSFLILLLVRKVSGESSMRKYGLVIIALLVLLTGISWTASQLIADIFTPIAVLSLILILTGKQSKKTLVFLFVLYFISVCMHLSHFLVFSILLIVIMLLRKWLIYKDSLPAFYPNRSLWDKSWVIAFVLTIGSIFTMGSAISKSKDVFLMGSLVEQGIAKQYLDEHCSNKQYKICAYKDSLPKTFNAFVWDTNSVFYKTGGWSAENRKEYDDIIMATFTEPSYILLHIKASCKATLHQLLSFHIADGNGAFAKGTLLYSRIIKYCKHDSAAYCNSKQNRGFFSGENLFIKVINKVNDISAIIAIAALLLLMLVYRKQFTKQTKALIFLALFAILVSAWDAATFSTTADRFGCKIMWMLTGFTLFTLFSPKNELTD